MLSHVNIDLLSHCLSGYPDKSLADFVLNGLRNGFDIGFEGVAEATLPKNLRSAKQNATRVTKAIIK